MEVNVDKPRAGVCRVCLVGRLDMDGVEAAEGRFNAVMAEHPVAVIVDLSGVTFISSVGLRLLMTGGKSMAKQGGALLLVNPDAMARNILTSTGIDQVLPVFEGLDAALASLS